MNTNTVTVPSSTIDTNTLSNRQRRKLASMSAAAKRSVGIVKPCPCCGGEARLRKHYKIRDAWYVQCIQCGLKTPISAGVDAYTTDEDNIKCVLDKWNSRV